MGHQDCNEQGIRSKTASINGEQTIQYFLIVQLVRGVGAGRMLSPILAGGRLAGTTQERVRQITLWRIDPLTAKVGHVWDLLKVKFYYL